MGEISGLLRKAIETVALLTFAASAIKRVVGGCGAEAAEAGVFFLGMDLTVKLRYTKQRRA